MKSMVEQVVEVLDDTDLDENVLGKSLSQMGYGKSRYDKKAKMQYRPADPTFFRHDKHWMKDKKNVKFLRKRLVHQEIERRRKLMKKRYPNDPLEWSGSRWVVKTTESVSVRENDERDRDKERQRKELKMRYPNVPLRWTGSRWVLGEKKPTNKEIDDTRKRIKEELEQLKEISVRTGSITVFLAKVKQYANKVTSHVSKRRTLASKLETATGTDVQKIQGEIARLEAETDEYERKMIMYNSLISAAGGLGNDRSYKLLKKLEKKKR